MTQVKQAERETKAMVIESEPDHGDRALTTVTPRIDNFIAQILPSASRERLFASLPRHIRPEVFERNLFNAIATNPWLTNYSPALVFREISKCAGLGLLLDPILGEAYLIEGYNGKTQRKEPQLRVGYKGMNKLARQSGNVAGLWCHEIHERDKVTVDLGFPKVFHHNPVLFGERGPIIGYAATIAYKDGTFDFEPMSLVQCLEIRDRSDAYKAFKADKIKSTPWATDQNEMCKKTAFRRLMKRQDQSPQMRAAIQIEDEAEFPHMVQHEPLVQIKAPAPPEDETQEQPETPVHEHPTEAAADVNSRRKPKARTTKRGEPKDGLDEVLEGAAAEVPQDPENLLKWIDARLGQITDPFDLADVWQNECEEKLVGAFPPDVDAANVIYDKHEKRLEPS